MPAASPLRAARHLVSGLVSGLVPGLALIGVATIAGEAAAQNAVSAAYVGTVSDIGLYLAERKGYFRAEGLDVTLTQIDLTNKMVPMLGTGDLDVGSGTVAVGIYNAVSRGVGVKVVADKGSVRAGYGYEGLLVRKDLVEGGRYRNFADLKGMKIAVASFGSGNSSGANQALKRGGLTFADASFVTLPFPQHLTAFANKAIDASMTNEPTITLAVEKGVAVKIAGNDTIYPQQQTAILLYSEKFVRTRPEAAVKFMRAYIRAVRDYNDALVDVKLTGPNADEIVATLTQYTSIKSPDLLRKITPAAVNPDGRVNLDGMRMDLAFYREQGLVQDAKITAEDIVDMSFVDKVVGELGPYRPRR
ncbi:MAG TPA: ABC transporter substrate-binding protein [Xanthobacteraceae bacterium]|nr:ABC transporter substrate-binding protein [Xanthobacteraceae bacterium]